MSKLLHFPTPPEPFEDALTFIEESKKVMLSNNPKSIIISVKMEDGSIMTGYHDCDFGTRMEMLGHINADVIDQMILENIGSRY